MLVFLSSLFFLNFLNFKKSNVWYLSVWVLFFLSFSIILNFYSYMGVMKMNWCFMMDEMSCCLAVLSCWISALMIMSSSQVLKYKSSVNFFLFSVMILNLLIVLVFSQKNLFLFYIFFESSLIPTLLLILVWGYQPERLQAGMYMIIYTVLGALPFLLLIFMLFKFNGHLSMILPIDIPVSFNKGLSNLWWLGMMMVFMIKLPLYGVHLWLPKAHVQAPVAGSMILAGLLLKLGGYGVIRLVMMFGDYKFFINEFFVSLSLVGGLISSLICIRQSDMKSLIAYSSVAHMGIMMVGVLSGSELGVKMGLLMMIAHGLCSSGLFSSGNMLYEKISSRSLFSLQGFICFSPNFSLWFFLLCVTNMAAPPSLNLLSEIGLIISSLFFSKILILFIGLMSFSVAVYSLMLFVSTQHGDAPVYMNPVSCFYSINYVVLFAHWFPVQLMIFMGSSI
uniref:NADH-ubiquinone oxidoreductase chain 4 n=1 Tax=Nuttallina californica TaxID=413430 RepID=A0A0E3DEF5_9MOLL|nr:NADH dehydrogenase subunit 4 [Nuttallina californica]AIA77070.1 NADH dehydrogenase subunit 4 [Nuttallina californica]